MNNNYDIAAYIWPAYGKNDSRSRIFWEQGIGEWQTVMNAKAKFEGHSWPRKPLWGYVNEADPYVMEMQIEAATDYGINTFIYDWYWYDRRPFLEACLNDGFLKAKNRDKMKFYLMWAAHDVPYLWDIRNSDIDDGIIWQAAVDRHEFEIIANRLIDKYFTHPCYYKIDGKPVFMIYGIAMIIKGLGGEEKAASAFDWFREQCIKKGLPGLHLQLDMPYDWSFDLAGVNAGLAISPESVIDKLKIDSLTHYHWCHFADMNKEYNEIIPDAVKEWNRLDSEYNIPYFPNVSLGWDNNPRYKNLQPIITKNNTPDNIKTAFEQAKNYADEHKSQPPLITINSWNEWTEGSYLQPDDINGYGYLEALKQVFLKDGT